VPPFPNGSEFVPRPRQDQYTVVVRNAPPQDGLKHVVDRDLVSLGDWPDVQPCDQATLADVHVLVFTKVLLDGNAEPGIGRDHQEDVEVKAAVAEDERGRPRILLVDLQIGSPDEERKIVGRSGPRLPMRPGDERRIDLWISPFIAWMTAPRGPGSCANGKVMKWQDHPSFMRSLTSWV
jgi:hypothetical protein